MFSLIRGLLFLVACFVAIGLFRGWFDVSRQGRDPATGQVNYNFSVDTQKVRSDITLAEQKVVDRIAQQQQLAQQQRLAQQQQQPQQWGNNSQQGYALPPNNNPAYAAPQTYSYPVPPAYPAAQNMR